MTAPLQYSSSKDNEDPVTRQARTGAESYSADTAKAIGLPLFVVIRTALNANVVPLFGQNREIDFTKMLSSAARFRG